MDVKEPAPPSEDLLTDAWDTLTKKHLDLPRLGDDELRKFVVDVLAGRVFTSAQVRDQSLISMIFMPLALGALHEYVPESLLIIGVLWEYLEQALPRGINGYPMFTSVRMMHRLDWDRARKALILEQERQKSLELPPDDPAPEKT